MIVTDMKAQTQRRFALGLGFSVLLHAALGLGIGTAPAERGGLAALTVELFRDMPAATSAAVVADTPADRPVPVHAASVAPAMPARLARPHAAMGITLPADRYYTASELDLRAQQVNDVALVYPKAAYEMRIGGRVVVNILISDTGKIDALSVLESEPAGVFDDHALAAAEALEFVPAVKDGQPVKSRKKIEIVYDPYQSINVP